MDTVRRIFDAAVVGLIVSAVFALLSFMLTSTSVGPAVENAFTSLGAMAMKPFGYSTFAWFKELVGGGGPGVAYLQTFVLSGLLWAVVFALLFGFTCWWRRTKT